MSSANSSSKIWKYDVFLSFRGPDTRKTFVSYLYYSLELRGIRAFKDDYWLETGKSVPDELLKAIEDSRFAIIIFSRSYAYSKWCLEELAHIIKCKNELGQIVIPIFYDVSCSNVRRQSEYFADAFDYHEEVSGVDMEKIQRWRDALTEAGELSGFNLKYFRDEAACVKELISCIFPKSWKYDVYMSFRGADTRRTFVSYLYDALEQNGIHTFKDDNLMESKENSEECMKAIEVSKFAIVIFSKRYAESRWCLEELAHIIRCKNELGQIVIPIFYDVSPSDMNRQNTSMAEYFTKNKKICNDDDREKIQRWRDGIAEAREISGHHLENYKDDVDCIKKVVDFISPKSFKFFPFRKA